MHEASSRTRTAKLPRGGRSVGRLQTPRCGSWANLHEDSLSAAHTTYNPHQIIQLNLTMADAEPKHVRTRPILAHIHNPKVLWFTANLGLLCGKSKREKENTPTKSVLIKRASAPSPSTSATLRLDPRRPNQPPSPSPANPPPRPATRPHRPPLSHVDPLLYFPGLPGGKGVRSATALVRGAEMFQLAGMLREVREREPGTGGGTAVGLRGCFR
ncbi:hypothetical protein EJ03DRAFT_38550 [Teratosphaeria nubilosa]|uniref:Uncharacterized protein n=1 Tax=Teratosphaeria nubilosa TaxID=161662 RepID=A0A6G1LEM6_9PEZI|nr:hypothetical protein EJ03DRAFT_38550 [Teratosphaeria nubilosa]